MDQTVDILLTYYSVTFKRLQHHFINYANFSHFYWVLGDNNKQTWVNNSTGDCFSSLTRQLDNNSCKYTWQINIDLTWLVLTRVGLKRVNWEYMIRYVPYRAFTWLRYHSFDYRLKDEPRVVTPIRQSLIKSFIFQR